MPLLAAPMYEYKYDLPNRIINASYVRGGLCSSS